MIKKINKNKGFTILETLIAVVLLSLVLNSVLTLISRSLFTAQYAKNDMIASYLLQESADYIRNTRDTQMKIDPAVGWGNFLDFYNLNDSNGQQTRVCKIKIYPGSISSPTAPECSNNNGNNAPDVFYYHKDTSGGSYYSTEKGSDYADTTFSRLVVLSKNNSGDEVDVSITINWKNGNNSKSKSYNLSFTDWQTN
ncbi:MAG: prepilin-type N-terminal cleavage/methylation domain-containing protein [Candidatus Pacebacteria bacterium]|nr:prepilin-type N-terminal cleavage/methylation domain-containing protein [Candidatus Paceibacterota bacterium]MBP9715906.1 prepilin-type N-terminal cleavage/methylation domain-containing protein [Candidatus Paceibacterota bacterium]